MITVEFQTMSEQSIRFEPIEFGEHKQKTDTITDVSSLWLDGRVQDSVLSNLLGAFTEPRRGT